MHVTWDASAAAVERAVSDLAGRGVPVRMRRARRATARQARREATAHQLLIAAGRAPRPE